MCSVLLAINSGRQRGGELSSTMWCSRAGISYAIASLLALLCFSCSHSGQGVIPETRHRSSFVAALSQVQPAMGKGEVLRLLGAPDTTRTVDGSSYLDPVGARELWCYGVFAGLPTLGTVAFDRSGKVIATRGGKGQPPSEGMFHEADLRRLIGLISQIAEPFEFEMWGGWKFNPAKLIECVNALQVHGKERALAAIEETLRVGVGSGAIFLVLRALFELPDKSVPSPVIRIGIPHPPEPDDPNSFPMYPVVLIDDIPLLLVAGYAGTGMPQSVLEHIAYFRQHGTIREKPLRPPDNPAGAIRALDKSDPFTRFRKQQPKSIECRSLILSQCLRMIDTVYPVEADPLGMIVNANDLPEEQWESSLTAIDNLHIVWDPRKSRYAFADRSRLR